jgi:hypothetical protein
VSEPNCAGDVILALAEHYCRRPQVDVMVPDAAERVIACIAWHNDFAVDAAGQLLKGNHVRVMTQ